MTNREKQPNRNTMPPELATREPTELLEAMGAVPEETGGTITIKGEPNRHEPSPDRNCRCRCSFR